MDILKFNLTLEGQNFETNFAGQNCSKTSETSLPKNLKFLM